jgi:hypothetical protein
LERDGAIGCGSSRFFIPNSQVFEKMTVIFWPLRKCLETWQLFSATVQVFENMEVISFDRTSV